MPDIIWTIDRASGEIVVEGLAMAAVSDLVGDLLPPPQQVNCGRPRESVALPMSRSMASRSEPLLRVARIYHGSVVDGPGRRSVVQFQGCPIRCPACHAPETHDPAGGIGIPVTKLVALLLDPSGEPRNGAAVLGGEPFYQPAGLLVLLRTLKVRGVHVVVYTGYTIEALIRRPEPEIREALRLIDLLIDGPYVAALADGAGEWRGSRNQRVLPAQRLRAAMRFTAAEMACYTTTRGEG